MAVDGVVVAGFYGDPTEEGKGGLGVEIEIESKD